MVTVPSGAALAAATPRAPRSEPVSFAESLSSTTPGAVATLRFAESAQPDQGCGPSVARMRSATAICWLRVAPFGSAAYWVPP